ncbi:cyclic nucleotide-binding protein [Chitinophaga parva]|uniref:Cyclic nucleotide-binding protein n=1 Tax=Chitinophaga parva TaxID=2169414 RepID=A0A2T7BQC9_9BACT|nr:cyclic nucleotide-binding protein [Chitinophaga parva]
MAQLEAFFEGRLGPKEKAELATRFTARQVKRRGFLLHQGEVCRHFSFVVSGCFKMYATDPGGKEHNLEFGAENDWLCDLGGFYAKKPSDVYIEAIEAATVLQIARPDLIYLYGHYPRFNTGFRVITERKYIELQNRLLQTISATAEERYQLFLQQYPHLVRRLPNTQIASYLGITPEFLSKIRKDLSRA